MTVKRKFNKINSINFKSIYKYILLKQIMLKTTYTKHITLEANSKSCKAILNVIKIDKTAKSKAEIRGCNSHRHKRVSLKGDNSVPVYLRCSCFVFAVPYIEQRMSAHGGDIILPD